MEEKDIIQEQENVQEKEVGNIKIADEVVSIIAGLAAADIAGVAGMSSGITSGLAEFMGTRNNLTKGVKVDIKEKEALIDLYIIVKYGCRIPEVAWEIQEKVKNAVETMTGLNVTKVNIHIQGVHIEKEKKKELPDSEKKQKANKKLTQKKVPDKKVTESDNKADK